MEEGNQTFVSKKRKSQSPSSQVPPSVIKIEDDLDLLMPIEGLSKNFSQESEYIKKEKEKQDNSSPPQVKRGKQEVPNNELPRLIPFNLPKPEPIDISDDPVPAQRKPKVPSPTQLYSKINAEHRQVICMLDNKQRLLVNIQSLIARKSGNRNQEFLNYQRQGTMLVQEIQQLTQRKFILSTELARLASIVTSDSAISIVEEEEVKVKDEKISISPIDEVDNTDVINLVEDENEEVNPSIRVEQEQTKREKTKETHIQAYRDNLTRNFDTMVKFQSFSKSNDQPDMAQSEFLLSKLMAHQTQGLHWMFTRETDPLNKCKGGILADDMGLGKTIQTIALILANPRPAECAGTLIVCPLSTLDQWEDEIVNKVSPRAGLTILKYYGSGRTDDPDELARYDIVLTTFGTMSNEYSETESKTLASVDWHRIVLDEAHTIKNCNSRTAKAACKLSALHRWCLTGTPIQNGLWELFSLLNFIQCEGLEGGRTWFRKNVVKAVQNGDVSGYNHLRVFLNAVVLRRTKHQTIRGNRLMILPDLHIEIRKIVKSHTSSSSNKSKQLSSDEQLFYKALEEQASSMYETFRRSGTIRNNFMHIFELLLRLRQCCDHSYLVLLCLLEKRKGKHYSEASQIYKEMLVSLKSGDRELANAVVQKLFNNTGNATCAICMDELNDAHATTPCGHMFCKECIEDWMDRNTANPLCPMCRTRIATLVPRRTAEDQVANFEAERAKAAKLVEEQEQQEEQREPSVFDTLSGPNATLVSLKNSKLEAFMEELNKFPGRKTLVFCQFTMLMDMLEVLLTNAKIHYVRLDGSMSKEDRSISTDEFDKNPNCTVYLISLKAGGTGLNLVSATQVFIMDPWWNPAVESQAIDRAYRFGQYADVRVVHFITQDAIEAKIQELQESKRAVAEQALNGSGTADGLRIRDLNVLFRRNAFYHIGQNNANNQSNNGH